MLNTLYVLKISLLSMCIFLVSACSTEKDNTNSLQKQLPEVPLTLNLESYSLPVQNQLQKRIHYISLVDKKASNQNNSKYGWAVGQLGRVYHAYSLLTEARDSYLNAIFYEPSNFEWYYLLAHIYKDLGELEESKSYFKKVLKFKNYIPAKIWLSDVLLKLNDYQGAEALCNEVLLIESNHPRAMYNLALINQHYNKNEIALKYLLTVLEIQPVAYQLHYQIGQVYVKLGQFELAKKHNNKVVDDNNLRVSLLFDDPLIQNVVNLRKDDLTFMTKAQKATAHGKYKKAILILQKILKTNPKQLEALYKLAINYQQLNNTKKAKLYIKEVIEIDPNYDKAYSLLATININENELSLAMDNINKALTNKPLYPFYLNKLADIYYRQGDYSSAANQFIKSLDIKKDQELIHLKYMRTLLVQESYSDVIEYIESVPVSDKFKNSIDNIILRIKLTQSGENLNVLTTGIKPNNVMSQETLAMIAAKNNKFSQAILHQNKALDMSKLTDLKRIKTNVRRIKQRLELYQSGKMQKNIWLPFEPLQTFELIE